MTTGPNTSSWMISLFVTGTGDEGRLDELAADELRVRLDHCGRPPGAGPVRALCAEPRGRGRPGARRATAAASVGATPRRSRPSQLLQPAYNRASPGRGRRRRRAVEGSRPWRTSSWSSSRTCRVRSPTSRSSSPTPGSTCARSAAAGSATAATSSSRPPTTTRRGRSSSAAATTSSRASRCSSRSTTSPAGWPGWRAGSPTRGSTSTGTCSSGAGGTRPSSASSCSDVAAARKALEGLSSIHAG